MKATERLSRTHRFLRPWLVGAGIWGLLSCILLAEYQRQGDPDYLWDMFWLLAFLWLQFGFAALFNAVYSRQHNRLTAYIAVTILPPLIVCVVMGLC